MEGKPFDIIHQDEARDEHQFGKGIRINTLLLVLLELDAGILELKNVTPVVN